jgi:hypothetical protein
MAMLTEKHLLFGLTIGSLIISSLLSSEPAFGRIEEMQEYIKETNSKLFVEPLKLISESDLDAIGLSGVDVDPYSLIDDAIRDGYASETPDMFVRPDFLAERLFSDIIYSFSVWALPETRLLDDNNLNINRFANNFDVVFVINSAVDGKKNLRQMGYVFEKSLNPKSPKELFELKSIFRVTSGVPAWGAKKVYGPGGKILLRSNGTPVTKRYYKGTEAGYFPVTFIETEHETSLPPDKIEDINLPVMKVRLKFFIGYNPKDGQGMHVEKISPERNPLSHGCVRLGNRDAAKLFTQVKATKLGGSSSERSEEILYVDKRNGFIKAVKDFPIEILLMPEITKGERRSKAIAKTQYLELQLSDRLENFNKIGDFKTLVIVNGAPNMDYSDLAKEKSEAVLPTDS